MTGPKAFIGYIILGLYALLLIMGIVSLYLWKIQRQKKKKFAPIYLIVGIVLLATLSYFLIFILV
ncbi:MAG: hypothetical protein KKF89_04495 [Nanoarchaeota archaeon]|nr:hypothetical protein [Nanoarchaeota archaeon]MBU1854953.1 hypothetical protein [Nanoarchaeota archaeon]